MAIQNDVQNAELAYLLFPFEQYSNLNGKPLVGGHIEVFEAGTDNRYLTYQDWNGDYNPFKIPIPEDGRIVALADPSLAYDVYVYDSFNNLVCSRLNLQCNVPGSISIKGADTRINNTDGTLDIELRTLGNNVRQYTINTRNKLLDVQDPLYFVENSTTATVIGIKGGAYATPEDVENAITGKLDTTAFSAVSGDFLTDKFEYDDNFNITGYDGSAFASNGQTYTAGTNIDITDNVISVTGLPTSSDVENAISSAVTNVENKFEYNENNYITAYNNSAFAGTNYSAGDYVSIENDTISVTGLQPSGDYATKTELESATSGKMDVTGMTAYQPTGDYATHDDLTAYQPVGDYYSASNPSGFITNDAITGLQPSGDYVTHDEMTGYQPVGDYYSASNPSGFITNDAITGLQPSGDYATHDDLTAYATTALVSSVSSELYSAISSISGDFELVAGSGVELVDDPNAKTTTINVTAECTPVTAIEQMIESATSGLQPSGDYATTAQVAEKLDTTAFSTVSGSFLTAHQDLSDYATTAELAEKLDTSAFSDVSGTFLTAHQDLSDYQTTAGMTAYQPVGSYLTADALDNVSANWNEVSAKLDTTAFSDVSGSFLTAHQDISNKLDTTAFSDVSGSFLTAVPDTYLQNTDLTIVDNKITEISGVPLSAGDELPEVVSAATDYVSANSATINGTIDTVSSNSANWGGEALPLSSRDGIDLEISGDMLYIGASALSAAISAKQDELTFDYNASNAISAINGSALAGGGGGGDVPEGVMAESGLEFNAVNEISGYNGSAIAQYGADKQWLVHDDTLVHAANSAQYALGVNVSAVASLMPAPTILSTGTCDLNTNVFSGTSYVYWWKLSNGICRIKGWLRPNPANTPNQWNFVSFASGAPSAMFNNTIIPTVIDFGGWADFIHWNEDGTLVFNTREVKLSAANQLVNFEFYGYYKEV